MTGDDLHTNNLLVDCRSLHGELLDLETGYVWQTHRPIDRTAYHALDLPKTLIKVGVGVGVMDEHYFRRSPGAEIDGPVATREIAGHLFIHCANPPKGGPETPLGPDPKLLRVEKHHSLIFHAGREVSVIRDESGRDFVQVIPSSREGDGILQDGAPEKGAAELPLPDGWSVRTEKLDTQTTIHLPNPTEAWFFASGASYQGPVDSFKEVDSIPSSSQEETP